MRILLFLSALLLAGCAHHPSFEEAKEKIHQQNEKLHKVIATKNIALLKEVYAEDANLLAPGLNPIKGRDTIIAIWADGIEDVLEMRSHSIEFGGTPEVVYEVGLVENSIRYHNPDTVIVHKAKYTNVWRLDAQGDYRLVVDIYNKVN